MGRDLNDIARDIRDDFIREHVGQIDAMAEELESPLEVAMLWALCALAGTTEPTGLPCRLPGASRDPRPVIFMRSVADPVEIQVWPRVEVVANGCRYRLDFAIVARLEQSTGAVGWSFVDLELDGHDYHERTKEQAERDKKRDRDLQSIGWNVARFTGSQVYRDAAGVAGEVFSFASGLAWRSIGVE